VEASALPAPALVSQDAVLDAQPLGPTAVGRLATVTPLRRLRSDDQLVALFRAGNEHAFEAIHDRYRQRLFVYARQMLGGSRQDAEDALQDVFMRAYGGLRANGRPVSLKAWLYRVAHNRCVDQIRRPRPVPVEVVENPRGSLHDPIEMAERREDLRRLVADVQRLPSQQRSVLLMREIDGLAYSELAEAHDVTVPAVKSLLVRARMGLVEAREARDTACRDVRGDLCLAHDRGVRVSGLARRHLRDCAGCRDFRTALRSTRRSFGALVPGTLGPLGALLHALGIGGSGGGGAAGAGAGGTAVVSASGAAGGASATGAAASGIGAVASGTAGAAATGVAASTGAGGAVLGGAGALTATKVAAVVASAAVVAGGSAVEVNQMTSHHAPAPISAPPLKVHRAKPPVARAAVPTDAALGPKSAAGASLAADPASAAGVTATAPTAPADPVRATPPSVAGTGGTEAPAELAESPGPASDPSEYVDPSAPGARPGGSGTSSSGTPPAAGAGVPSEYAAGSGGGGGAAPAP
jgi:RNA polymerase sigma factor (sigma-70 family)